MKNRGIILSLAVLSLIHICYSDILKAKCTMVGTSAVPEERIMGTVNFEQDDSTNSVTVNLDLSGFDTTDATKNHGFHIHTTGSISDSCSGAGSHFNGVTAGSSTHGARSNAATARHVGDLGNIAEDTNGKVVLTFTDTIISLKPASNNYIVNRAAVVHENEDDLGLGGQSDSSTTGHSGKRVGCCVIETSSASKLPYHITLLFVPVMAAFLMIR